MSKFNIAIVCLMFAGFAVASGFDVTLLQVVERGRIDSWTNKTLHNYNCRPRPQLRRYDPYGIYIRLRCDHLNISQHTTMICKRSQQSCPCEGLCNYPVYHTVRFHDRFNVVTSVRLPLTCRCVPCV